MPRKPKLTRPPTALPQRPAPPDGLPEAAGALWRSIVLDYPIDHFRGANLALLETFCCAWGDARRCNELITLEGLILDGKAHPAVAIRAGARTEMRYCMTKLRLAISSVARAEAAKVRPSSANALRKPWQK